MRISLIGVSLVPFLNKETFSLLRNCILAHSKVNTIPYIPAGIVRYFCDIIEFAIQNPVIDRRLADKLIFGLKQLEKLQEEFSDNQIIMRTIFNFDFKRLESDFSLNFYYANYFQF